MYTLGIDIGSTTSKCAILKDGTELVATSLQRGGLGTSGPEEALSRLWRESGLSREDMERAAKELDFDAAIRHRNRMYELQKIRDAELESLKR